MGAWLVIATGTSPGLGDVAIYGFAAPLVLFMGWAIRTQREELKAKDAVIDKLNTRVVDQGEAMLAQAERVLPLLTESNRVLVLAVEALNDLDPPPDRRRRV